MRPPMFSTRDSVSRLTPKCYSVKTWQELKVLYNHTAAVMDVAWGPDRRGVGYTHRIAKACQLVLFQLGPNGGRASAQALMPSDRPPRWLE